MNRERFLQFWSVHNGRDGESVFERLNARYGEPHRAYHHGEHIADCLREFDRVPARPPAVEMAIWFHDVIYDSRKKDNEEESALYFLDECRRAEMSGDWVADVCRLIRVTARHHPSAPDEAILCDVDLSILAREPEEYARYVAAVRREYAWVSESDWRVGRAAVLRSFLERPVIYNTPEYRSQEPAARGNMEREIRSLSLEA